MAKATGKQCVNKSLHCTSHLKLVLSTGQFVATHTVKNPITDHNHASVTFHGTAIFNPAQPTILTIRLSSYTPNNAVAVMVGGAAGPITDGVLQITLVDTAAGSPPAPLVADTAVEYVDDAAAP